MITFTPTWVLSSAFGSTWQDSLNAIPHFTRHRVVALKRTHHDATREQLKIRIVLVLHFALENLFYLISDGL